MKKAVFSLLALAGILIAMGIHQVYRGARVKSAQPCRSMLMNIAAAKEQWAMDTGATSGAPVTVETIAAYLRSMPTCHVAGATYVIGKLGEEPRCTVHGSLSHFSPDRY